MKPHFEFACAESQTFPGGNRRFPPSFREETTYGFLLTGSSFPSAVSLQAGKAALRDSLHEVNSISCRLRPDPSCRSLTGTATTGTLFFTMPGPESPSDSNEREAVRRATRQPLYIRLYFEDHMTALVRLFGYEGLPVPEAQENLKALVEKYGEEKIREATDEIIEFDTSNEPPIARLTKEARHLSVQILGSPPEAAQAEPRQDDGSPEAEAKGNRSVSDDLGSPADAPTEEKKAGHSQTEPDASQTPAIHPETKVRLPRTEILERFQKYLREQKRPYVLLDADRRKTLTEANLGTADLIVFHDPKNRIVTVRASLRAKEQQNMQGWQEVFGDGFEASRVWPVETSDSWDWRWFPIEPKPTTSAS